MIDIDKKEVLRYLGCSGNPDEKTDELVDLCITEISLLATPKTV